MKRTYYRGELYYADLGIGVGSEQNGYRPVVIIQNDVGNKHSPTTIVAAISTKSNSKAKLPTHFYIPTNCGLTHPSIIMLEQVRTIDKSRIDKYIGKLSPSDIRGLNHSLAISIGLIPVPPSKITLCLCKSCANNFYGTGSYHLRRVDPLQAEQQICTYCGLRRGFDYYLNNE